MNLGDFGASVLRTAVPSAWGTLIAFLVSTFGWLSDLLERLNIDPNSQNVRGFATGLAILGWYALWRWLEKRLPKSVVTLVLGLSKSPQYSNGVLMTYSQWLATQSPDVGDDAPKHLTT